MIRSYDDPNELRKSLDIAPRLDGIAETEVDGLGPCWSFGRICLAKGYPAWEIHDLLRDLLPESTFRKVRFDFPNENLRGFAVVLPYARDAETMYECMVGQVSLEREHQVDEWIAFLNAEIRAAQAAKAARNPSRS